MIIAIDYDQTFSAAPQTWADVIALLRLAGHDVICVTGREDKPFWSDGVRKAFAGHGLGDLPIIFAGLRWKEEAAKAAGWDVDIWIDDKPDAVRLPNPTALYHLLKTDEARQRFGRRVVLG